MRSCRRRIPTITSCKEIQIGGEGGWDYLIVDPGTHRLYVSHATKIVVADTETGKVVGEIPDTRRRARLRARARSRARVHEQRPRELVDDRRSEDAEAARHGADRRQSRQHSLSAGSQGSLDLQPHGRVDHGVRPDDRQGHRDHRGRRRSSKRRSKTRRRIACT